MGKMEAVTLIAVDPSVIEGLRAEVAALRNEIRGATIKPRDEWEPIKDHATRVGVQPQTVRAWIRAGKIDSKKIGGVTLVRG